MTTTRSELAARQWCDGLRSGQHQQERGAFWTEYGMCAVQVGAYETGLNWQQLKRALDSDSVDDCERKNDQLGWSFPQIADHIERETLAGRRELESER